MRPPSRSGNARFRSKPNSSPGRHTPPSDRLARTLKAIQRGAVHVILIRHAHAEDGENDAARPLSRKGARQARAMARLLRGARAFDAGEIWHSPLVRARQTAVLLAKHLDTDARLREVGGIRPGDDPAATARQLGSERRPVAVVGHDPHLSELATLLVTGEATPLRFKLKKGAAIRLDRTAGTWVVRWLVTPDLAG